MDGWMDRWMDGWINIVACTRENYEDLSREGGRPDLAEDERIFSARTRITNADSLYGDVAEVLTQRTTADWLVFCDRARIPASAIPTSRSWSPPRPRTTTPWPVATR
jgi:crotonobetainyl-CoA:carnitine CoA-transferase CaiB-like acyl-CoA transferase